MKLSSLGGAESPFEPPPVRQRRQQRVGRAAANLCRQASAGLRRLHERLCSRVQTVPPTIDGITLYTGTLRFSDTATAPLLHDRYRVLHALGEGTFSQLVEAEDTYHPARKRVAIKILNADCAFVGEQEQQVLSELRSCVGFEHCHIVRLHNAFYFGEHFCLVLELLGASLRSWPIGPRAAAEGRLSVYELRKCSLQCLVALEFLRRQRMIHADIKPENLLRSRAQTRSIGSLTLIDFGNALPYASRAAYYDYFELQSLLYRAPEVVIGSFEFGYGIDMWSLGCVLFELYTGRVLFAAQNSRDLLAKMQTILGRFPLEHFRSAKFYHRYERDQRFNRTPTSKHTELEALNKLSLLLQCPDREFVTLLGAMLRFNPSHRITPLQALRHPFFSHLIPLNFLFPAPSDVSVALNESKRLEMERQDRTIHNQDAISPLQTSKSKRRKLKDQDRECLQDQRTPDVVIADYDAGEVLLL